VGVDKTAGEPRGGGGWSQWIQADRGLIPLAAMAVLGVDLAVGAGVLLLALSAATLIGAALAAVPHAEVVAHRVGEPFGKTYSRLASR
jgi:Ca2+/H+ antiporter